MKLLFDQNISLRIIGLIEEIFPESNQVQLVELNGETDMNIWNFAKENDYTIVTYDADFYDLSVIKGFPPKIIWLRTGNATTREIANLIISRKKVISTFLEDDELACIQLF